MIFNDHSKLAGRHALLSPSGYNWINYKDDPLNSLFAKYSAQYAQALGTVVHEYAEKRIRYKLKFSKSEQKDLLFYCLDHGIPRNVIDLNYIFENVSQYVNDAIGYRMEPEVVLCYSDNCFGTADSISFDDGYLRIHDLKTGKQPAHIEQLYIYAALFCLEYKIKPSDIGIELRLYQADEAYICNPATDEIVPIIDKIVTFDKIINQFKEGSK